MSTAALTSFVSADPSAVAATVATVRSTYKSGRTRNMEFRKRNIRKLYWAIVDNIALIEAALLKDLRKPKLETHLSEIEWCKSECLDMLKSMDRWSQSDKVQNVPAKFWLLNHRVRYDPLGVVLIIGAYNFPLMLTLAPMIGAIAAGNAVVVKPSEASPYSAMVVQKLVSYLDPECYVCINGDVPVTKAVLDVKYDKILFTGGGTVGRIIAKKAAETMTPVILELGGQNPAFVTKNADIKLAAKRLAWQKINNAGQVCLSHNYALVHRSHVDAFIAGVKTALNDFFPGGAKSSPDYARLVNKGNYTRIKKMLDETKGKIVIGGACDEDELFIEPTVVLVDNIEDSMMVEESFGPIWSILPVDSLDEAIDIANTVDPTPLALYTFGNDAESNRILDNVASGGATVNDAFLHAGIPQSPLGGIGTSGQGCYHGEHSFRAFSHARSVAKVPGFLEKALTMRYPPYTDGKLKMSVTGTSPGFDRNGNVTKGLGYWLSFLFTLGGKSASGSVSRWGLLVTIVLAVGMARKRLEL